MNCPSLEKKVVSSALKSRDAFAKIEAASKIEETFTPYASLLLKLIRKFYDTDSEAKHADLDVIEGWIKNDLPSKNHELYINFLKECYSVDVSASNIAELVLETKRKSVGNKLATALLENDKKKIEEYKDKYSSLEFPDNNEEEEEDYCGESVDSLLEEDSAGAGARIKLLPKRLDDFCKSKTKRGHQIVIIARPNAGKTATTLTLTYGFALQGLSVLIFGNEEPVIDTRMRAISCFTGMLEEEIKADPAKAQALLDKRGWKNVRFIPLHPGTPKQIERYVERYKPDVIVVDQIRNLNVGADTRVNQLERAATEMRNIAKKHSCLVVSITQAGDSADNKLVLEMGDCDSSNTGIPAQADLMIGVGVNKEYEMHGLRMFNLPKNKIGGVHGNFQVKFNARTSRVEDI